MKSVIFWIVGIAVGFYTYYDVTSLERVRTILAILVAVTIIYSSNIHDRLERLEAASDSKDESIADLISDIDELKNKVFSLEESINSADNDALIARIEALEDATS